jgi:hypothetical protein
MGIVDHIVETMLSIAPDEWLTSLKIEAATSFLVEGSDGRDNLVKAKVVVPALRQPAVPTAQIAAIGKCQSADEGSALPEEAVVNHVSKAKKEGFHGRT